MDSTNFTVCVVDIRTWDPQEHSTVIIGEKDFYGYNDRPYDNYGGNGYQDESYGSYDELKKENIRDPNTSYFLEL